MARISTSSATQLLASGVSSTKDQAADLETYVLEAMAPREKPAINTLAGSPPYSVQIRRLLDSIPRGGPLWKLYVSWTWDVACLVNCCRAEQTLYICNTGTCLSSANRLHLRGFGRLDARKARVHSRPAYLPSAAKLAEWGALLEKNTCVDQKLQIATQIREHFQQTHALFEVTRHYPHTPRCLGPLTCFVAG